MTPPPIPTVGGNVYRWAFYTLLIAVVATLASAALNAAAPGNAVSALYAPVIALALLAHMVLLLVSVHRCGGSVLLWAPVVLICAPIGSIIVLARFHAIAVSTPHADAMTLKR